MDSRLGLKQIPAATGPARVRAAPKAPPKRVGDIWATVTIVKEHATSPGVQCKNCGKAFCGGAARIQDHITGLGVISACTCETDTFRDMKQELIDKSDDSASNKRQKAGEASVEAAADGKPSIKQEGKPVLAQQGIRNSLLSATSVEVDIAIAELIYGCNIPPAIVAHPLFKKLVTVMKTAPATYKPPDRNRLTGDLLDSTTLRLKAEEAPVREVVLRDCGTVVSDGWDDVARNHLINFLVGTAQGFFFDGTIQLSSEDSENADRVAELICAEIETTGKLNIIQVTLTLTLTLTLSRLHLRIPYMTVFRLSAEYVLHAYLDLIWNTWNTYSACRVRTDRKRHVQTVRVRRQYATLP
jgi:hypothetical protein